MGKTPKSAAGRLHATARRNIAFLVESSGLPRVEVAARVGKTDTWLRRYLTGAFNARLEDLVALAESFDRTLFDVLNAPAAPSPGEDVLVRNYRALPSELQHHLERQSGYLVGASQSRQRQRTRAPRRRRG